MLFLVSALALSSSFLVSRRCLFRFSFRSCSLPCLPWLHSSQPSSCSRCSQRWCSASARLAEALFSGIISPLERHRPNHALQRTEAGGGLFSVLHVLPRQPLSLSLSPLGDSRPPSHVAGLRFSANHLAAALRASDSASIVPPQPCGPPIQRPSSLRSVAGLRFSVICLAAASRGFVSASFGPPQRCGLPIQRHLSLRSVAEPRFSLNRTSAAQRSFVSASSGRVPSPNNALQRTEAGGRLFSVFHVLRRQPLSLSLGPLGPLPLCCVFGRHVGPRSLRSRGLPSGSSTASLSPSRRQCPSFPRRRVVGPSGGRLRTHVPNKALQRTGSGGRLLLGPFRLASPLPVAELGSLGPESLAWGFPRARLSPFASSSASVPIRSVATVCLPGSLSAPRSLSRRQRPSFPRRRGRLSFGPTRSPSVGGGLTTRSSEQRLAVASFPYSTLDLASLCR